MKLSEREWQVLRDCCKPPIERKLPRPGDSLVFDEIYRRLSDMRLIRWQQQDPYRQSMADDHYVFCGNWQRLLGVKLQKHPVLDEEAE